MYQIIELFTSNLPHVICQLYLNKVGEKFCPLKTTNLLIVLYRVAWEVKNLPAIQETMIQSLDLEDPLEKGMATHSSILAWRISWTEKPGGL